MTERKLLDKLGKLIKYKNGKGYISGIDIMNLDLDIATYCYVIEVLNRNDITIIRNKIFNNDEILNKVLEYKKSNDLELRNEIIEEFMYNIFLYASYFAKRYHIPVQELISYGCEAVIFSIENYYPTDGYSFTAYCNRNIKYFLREAEEVTNKKIDDDEDFYEFVLERCKCLSLLTKDLRLEISSYLINNPISFNSEEFLSYASSNQSDCSIRAANNRCFTDDILKKLSCGERELLELRYGLNGKSACSYRMIGAIQGIHGQVAYNREKKILAKIRVLDIYSDKDNN